MVKKRRLLPPPKREKSPERNEEVLSARDRFKGALQDLIPHSEEESESSDDEPWSRSKKSLPKKKLSTIEKQSDTDSNKFQQAFVMKLFDRSVDLAQFHENTPLYPICRAWIANQPHQVYDKSSQEEKEDDDDEDMEITEKDIEDGKDVYKLPPPDPAPKNVNLRVPEIILHETKLTKFYEEGTEPPSKDEILNDNLNHWKKVRKSWMVASAKNEGRYSQSFKILTEIYNRTQSNFGD